MVKRKTKVFIPEGLHPVAEWRYIKKFTSAELATLLKFDKETLGQIENGQEPNEHQKKRIQLITGIKL